MGLNSPTLAFECNARRDNSREMTVSGTYVSRVSFDASTVYCSANDLWQFLHIELAFTTRLRPVRGETSPLAFDAESVRCPGFVL